MSARNVNQAPMGAAPMGAAPGAAAPAPGGFAPPVSNDPVKPVTPQNPSVQETVAMRIGDAQDAVQETPVSAAPVFDESLNAWVIDDPVQGRLVHDSATDTWKPA